MRGRIIEIDQLKGLSIFLVVLRHLAVFCLKGEGYELNEFQKVLADVRLPLFFFLSGFVLKKVSMPISTLPIFLKQKFERLLLPFFTVGLILTYTVLDSDLLGFVESPFKSSYWYLWVTFIYCFILFFFNLISGVITKHKLLFDCILALSIWGAFLCAENLLYGSGASAHNTLGDILSFSLASKYVILFFFGVIVSKYKLQEFLFKRERIFTIALSLLLLFAYFRVPLLVVPQSHLLIATTSIICMGYIFFSVLPKSGFIMDKLALLGGRTLDVYVLHYFLLHTLSLSHFGLWVEQTGNNFIEFAVTIPIAIVIIIICIGVGNVLRSSRLLGYLLLGQKR